MRKFALLACLAATVGFTACSGETKTETTTTETTTTSDATATTADTAVVMANDTVATGAPLDSIHHAHMHASKGMVHNHEHGHPAADTAHHGQ